MTTTSIPICESCVHLGPGPTGFGHACAAFPGGIPHDIYPLGYDHRQPYAGDGGVRWALDPSLGAAERLAAYEAAMVEPEPAAAE